MAPPQLWLIKISNSTLTKMANRRRRSMRRKRETLSSMPNSFLNSLNRSFLGRSAKKAERAALNVALELSFFQLRKADEGII